MSIAETREKRGLALYRERGGEIEHAGGSVWIVPSQSGSEPYAVDLRNEICECPDRQNRGGACKHITAARIAYAKSVDCMGCGKNVRPGDAVEVLMEDHHLFFVGDLLCEECAIGHGVL